MLEEWWMNCWSYQYQQQQEANPDDDNRPAELRWNEDEKILLQELLENEIDPLTLGQGMRVRLS
jgi:hypothetical protein